MDNAEKAKFLLSLRIDEELDNSPLSEEDQVVLSSLLHEINVLLGTSISTFAELASLHLHGCGEIVAKYILLFSSESAKMELLHHLVYDRIANCGDLLCIYIRIIYKARRLPRMSLAKKNSTIMRSGG